MDGWHAAAPSWTAPTARAPGANASSPESMFVNRALKTLTFVYLVALIVAVFSYKAAFISFMFTNPFFGVYSVCVASYILSRFLLSLFYRSKRDAGIEPRIAIVMPGFNEQEAIAKS